MNPLKTNRPSARAEFLLYASAVLGADEVDRLADRTDGVVLAGARAARRAVELRRFGGGRSLWLDRAHYSSASGAADDGGLMDLWRLQESQLDVIEGLTRPAVAVPPGNRDGLRELLNAEPEVGRVVLPLAAGWLSSHVDLLLEEVVLRGRPVAIGFRDSFDPLDSGPRVRGFVKLCRSCPELMLLRLDVSGLGALAHGASAVAFGLSTATRHIPAPVRQKADSRRSDTPTGTGVFLPALLSHHRPATLQTFALLGSAVLNGLDTCRCEICAGRSLTRFAFQVDREEARAHDMAALQRLYEEQRLVPLGDRPDHWQEQCRRATERYQWLREHHRVALSVPRALTAWTSIEGRSISEAPSH